MAPTIRARAPVRSDDPLPRGTGVLAKRPPDHRGGRAIAWRMAVRSGDVLDPVAGVWPWARLSVLSADHGNCESRSDGAGCAGVYRHLRPGRARELAPLRGGSRPGGWLRSSPPPGAAPAGVGPGLLLSLEVSTVASDAWSAHVRREGR